MQWLGNTPEERQAYKAALLEAKRAGGFDKDKFDKEWKAAHKIAESAAKEGTERAPEKITDSPKEKPQAPASPKKPIKEPQEIKNSLQAAAPSVGQLERVSGDIIDAERGEDSAEGIDDETRQAIYEIKAIIERYKTAHDIETFGAAKNGALLFRAALMDARENVIKPTRILKSKVYEINALGIRDSKNRYDENKLIYFVDILDALCAGEGLVTQPGYYADLTGCTSIYRGNAQELTAARKQLFQKIKERELNASLSKAYGDTIGNIRNLNEGEAVVKSDRQAGRPYLTGAELKRLPQL